MARRLIHGVVILGSFVLVVEEPRLVPAQLARGQGAASASATTRTPPQDWLRLWEQNILGDARNRYCDKELGEEIGWRVSPFENGFLEGYEATHETKWLDLLVDWGDSWIARCQGA